MLSPTNAKVVGEVHNFKSECLYVFCTVPDYLFNAPGFIDHKTLILQGTIQTSFDKL